MYIDILYDKYIDRILIFIGVKKIYRYLAFDKKTPSMLSKNLESTERRALSIEHY